MKILKHRQFLTGVLFSIMLIFTSCQAVAPFFARAVSIAIPAAEGWVVTKTITYAFDTLFEWLFQSAAEETSEQAYIQNNVVPLSGNNMQGFFKEKHLAFYVQTQRGNCLNTDVIQIESKELPFYRTADGNWELTQASKNIIKERTEVAAAQRSLICYGITSVRYVDGKHGRLTTSALKEFQRKSGLAQTGELDYSTRQYLLTN